MRISIRILASKLGLKTLKKCPNRLIFHTVYILACHRQFDANPDPAYHYDEDPAYNFDADPDPTLQFDADPCGFGLQHCLTMGNPHNLQLSFH
jgi:hypothetical protein